MTIEDKIKEMLFECGMFENDTTAVVEMMKADEAKRLKELEIENGRLKKLVADLTLDKQILEETLKGKW